MKIDLTKYKFNDEDVHFLLQTEENCINGQNEVTLAYKGNSFVLEPRGKAVQVYAYGKVLGNYKDFDDLLLNHKIGEKPLIELIKDLEYGE